MNEWLIVVIYDIVTLCDPTTRRFIATPKWRWKSARGLATPFLVNNTSVSPSTHTNPSACCRMRRFLELLLLLLMLLLSDNRSLNFSWYISNIDNFTSHPVSFLQNRSFLISKIKSAALGINPLVVEDPPSSNVSVCKLIVERSFPRSV